jgi:hypothetical protein
MSPSLKQTDDRLGAIMKAGAGTRRVYATVTNAAESGWDARTKDTQERATGLSDRELGRLAAVVLRDSDRASMIPEWANDIPSEPGRSIPSEWFSRDRRRAFAFAEFHEKCRSEINGFEETFKEAVKKFETRTGRNEPDI